jgi:broad specificity phosphatase PhoE
LFSFCINARRRDVGDAEVMRDLGLRSGRRLVLAGLVAGICAAWGGLASLAFGQAATRPEPPRTILLIRHAEKLTDGQPDLSPAGFDRAKVIPQLFANGAAPHNLPRPDFLFATHVSKKSNRPVETITPLSAALGEPISHEIDDKDYAALAKELLSGKYADKVILVAWHHGSIPMLARELGASPPYDPWPETQFDRVWRIDYRGGKAVLTDLPQGLMQGDSR